MTLQPQRLLPTQKVILVLIYFAYGALVHFLLWEGLLRRVYPTRGYEPITDPLFPLIGGLLVAYFMIRLQAHSQSTERVNMAPSIVKGAWYGISATVLAVHFIFVITSLLASTSHPPFLGVHVFSYWLMSTATYGGSVTIPAIPFAAIHGAMGGALLASASRRGLLGPKVPVQAKGMATETLLLGLLAIIFAVAPFMGLICGVLAVIFGVRTLRRKEGGIASGAMTWIGVALGALVVLGLLYGFLAFGLLGGK